MSHHSVVAKTINMQAAAEQTHKTFYEFLSQMRRAIRDGESGLTQQDRADLIYLLKNLADLFDDIRKETNGITEQLEAILCTLHIAISAQPGKKIDKSVKGKIATVTPRLTTQPKIPSPAKEPTKYALLMKELGVTNAEVIERGVLRLHWPSMTEWCTERSEQGLPLPGNIDTSSNAAGFATTARKRSDVELSDIRKEVMAQQPNESTESIERTDEF